MQNKSSKKQASPRKRVSPAKKKLALEVIERLKKEYPIAECTLDYENAWQLLVSVRLAAQCTDARVDQITPLLYEKYPDVPALAAAEPEQIEEKLKRLEMYYGYIIPEKGEKAYRCVDLRYSDQIICK